MVFSSRILETEGNHWDWASVHITKRQSIVRIIAPDHRIRICLGIIGEIGGIIRIVASTLTHCFAPISSSCRPVN